MNGRNFVTYKSVKNSLEAQVYLGNDIKPENIIWDARKKTAKIVGFENIQNIRLGQKTILASRLTNNGPYAAPENKLANICSKQSDIYALGKTIEDKLSLSKPCLSYTSLMLKIQVNKMLSDGSTKRPTIHQRSAYNN